MRAMQAAVLTVLLIIAGFSAGPGTAESSDWWCWDDPILVISGQVVQILPGVPATERGRVRLAELTVVVPEGVDARLVASVAIWFPLTARLVRAGAIGADGSAVVTALLTVQAEGDFPTALRMRPANSGEQIAYATTAGAAVASLALRVRVTAQAPASVVPAAPQAK